MNVEPVWIIAVVAAVAAAVVGFLIGRARPDPRARQESEARIRALEAELQARQVSLEQQRAELAAYRDSVETHFDRTATLFVEMAGSYRNLFQHLSSDYEKLSDGRARERFQARISSLLLEDDRIRGEAAGADPAAAAAPAAAEPPTGPDDQQGTGTPEAANRAR